MRAFFWRFALPLVSVAGRGSRFYRPVTASEISVRFNPGHYVGLQQNSAGTGTRDSAELRAVDVTRINAIRAESAVVGVNIKKFWHYFEGPTEGDYSRAYDMIDAYLAMCTDGSLPKKRLLISIWPVVFSSTTTNIFPEYYTNYVATNYGYIARLWEATDMSKVIALHKAITDRYASNPYFEGIETTETAIAFDSTPSGFSNANVLTQFKRLASEYRTNAPTCALIVGLNYLGSNSQTIELIEHCRDWHVVMGGPDTWGIDWITDGTRSLQGDVLYRGESYNGSDPYTDYRGTVIWKNEIQNPEIGGHLTDGAGEHAPFTCADLYNTAYNINEAGYMLWEYNYGYGGDDQKWSTGQLPFIRANPNMRTHDPYNGVAVPVDPPGTGGTIEHVSTGTVVEADNASVSPGFGSTAQADDIPIVIASLTTGTTGRTLACAGYTTIASYGGSSQQPVYIFAKVAAASEANATVTVAGGSSGDVVQAVGLLLRGARADTGTLLHVSASKATTSANSSKAIDTPALTITEDGCFVLEVVNYQLNCTALSAPSGFTQSVFSSTTTGTNQTLAVNKQLQTTATNIAATTGGITITGQATGVTARVLAVALRAA